MTKSNEVCQLFAIAEAGASAGAGEAPARRLGAALAAAAIASVLIVPPAGRRLEIAGARPLVALAQAAGALALVLDDAGLANTLKADGVHLSQNNCTVDALSHARDTLPDDAIIGADAGTSRDDAMTLGERGAHYIAFSLPPQASDLAQARERRYEHVMWWAEIFELPCVAVDVETAHEAVGLAEAGADFVSVNITGGRAAAEIAERVRAFAAALKPGHAKR